MMAMELEIMLMHLITIRMSQLMPMAMGFVPSIASVPPKG